MSVCKLLQRSCLKQQPFAREEGRLSVFAHVNLSTQSFWMHLWGEKYSPGSPMSLVSQKPIPNNHTLIQRAHRVELCCAAGSTGLFVSSQNSFHASFQRLGYTVHTYTHTHIPSYTYVWPGWPVSEEAWLPSITRIIVYFQCFTLGLVPVILPVFEHPALAIHSIFNPHRLLRTKSYLKQLIPQELDRVIKC